MTKIDYFLPFLSDEGPVSLQLGTLARLGTMTLPTRAVLW